MSSQKKRRENKKAKQRYHTRKQKLLQERVQSTGQQIDGKKSRLPEKISKALKDFLVGYKMKRDKLSTVKQNAMMRMVVKISGRYQATKLIGLRRQTLACVYAANQRRQNKMWEHSTEAFFQKECCPFARSPHSQQEAQKTEDGFDKTSCLPL